MPLRRRRGGIPARDRRRRRRRRLVHGRFIVGSAGLPAACGPSLTHSAPLGQTCLADVQASPPDPNAAPDAKSAKVAGGLAKLLARAAGGIDGTASATKPEKRARQLKKARTALDKLLKKATKTDAKGRLNAPLAAIQTAVNGVPAQL